MRNSPNKNITEEEQKFWTRIKTYFFCEADESLHWSDYAWLLALGLSVLIALEVNFF